MKNNKLIVPAIICLVAGLVIFGIGFWMSNFDFKSISTEHNYTEKTFDSAKMYDSIVIKDKNTDVDIVKSKDDSFHITYFENEKRQYEVKENNETLTLTVKESGEWNYSILNFNFETTKTTIEIPEAFYGKIFAQTSNSNITLTDIKMTDIEAITSNDDITMREVICDGTATATSSNGDINIDRTNIGSDAKFRTSNSEVNITNTTCNNLTVDTNNGEVELANVFSKNFIYITTSNDDIVLDVVEFSRGLDCKSSNGNIEGTIVGEPKDFSITSKTSNGDNNLPENFNAGEKILKIITSNDDIEIEFTK